MPEAMKSIANVCHVGFYRGAEADPAAQADLLLEVPHGATQAHHFDSLRAELRGDHPDGLRDFFFVNTDVGSPELAESIASEVVAAQPGRTVMVVRSELPRTFIDCNRNIHHDTVARASMPKEMTPGLPPWVVDVGDRELLLKRYLAYREVVTSAFAAVCGAGGTALCVHTYAPRSIDVAVDRDIGSRLHEAYAPERITTWPLRAEIDLITHDEGGLELADADLARRVEAAFVNAGFQTARNETYSLHPSTLAFEFARQYPGQTLCFEVRRDLLLDAFVPFVELHPDPAAVLRVAKPLVASLAEQAKLGD